MVAFSYYSPVDQRRAPSPTRLHQIPDGYADRRLPSSDYNLIREAQDPRSIMMVCNDRDCPELPSSQRKRIAVACGRCRKRKIRCSGETGHGEPCTNCRNANHSPCQFLRVASTEATLRMDDPSFDSTIGNRTIAALASSFPGGIPILSSDPLPLRGAAAPVYGYAGRPSYYPVSDYSEEMGVDYHVSSPEFHQLSDPTYGPGHRGIPHSGYHQHRSGHAGVYMEGGSPGYEEYHGQSQVSTPAAPTPAAGDASPYPQPVLPTGLVSALRISNRSLPDPTRRVLPHHHYRHEAASSPAYGRASPLSGAGSPDSSADGPGYSSYSNSPSPSNYSAGYVSVSRTGNNVSDVYTTAGTDSAPSPASSASPPTVTGGSHGADMTYRYHDTTTRLPHPHSHAPHHHGEAPTAPMGQAVQGYLSGAGAPSPSGAYMAGSDASGSAHGHLVIREKNC